MFKKEGGLKDVRVTRQDRIYRQKCYETYIHYYEYDIALQIQRALNEKYEYNYNITEQIINLIRGAKETTQGFKVGSILENMNFVDYVLSAFGYDEEEKKKFICRNIRIVLGSCNDFKIRLAILNHFGFMEEAFFSKYRLLNIELENTYGLNTSGLYSICMGSQFANLSELEEVIGKVFVAELFEFRKAYPLNNETVNALYKELIHDLNKIKFRNDLIRRKQKLKNGDIC